MNRVYVNVELEGKVFKVALNDLYKTRDDNNLSTPQLVAKYSDRIKNGTL